MSLVIVGYDYEKFYDSRMDTGIFAIADSAITTNQGQTTLLSGFRKVYEMEAKIWKPYFNIDGTFRSYLDVYNTCPILVGFAGSTLIAQHILNSITGHIEKLRICHVKHTSPIEYQIINPCEPNPLSSNGLAVWEDDTFLDSDFTDLTKGETIANSIEHSINHALKSASKYRLSMEEYRAMTVDIVCGLWCPYKNEYQIYIYRMESGTDADGALFPYTKKELLDKDKVAVLGMRNKFDDKAQSTYEEALADLDEAIANSKSLAESIKKSPDLFKPISPSKIKEPSEQMYEFMEKSIDEVKSTGSKEIDRPISFRKLDRRGITRVQ